MMTWFPEARRQCVGHQRFVGHRPGATTVELALVLPLFLVLVSGIMEVGRFMMVNQLVTEASRAACRLAVLWRPTLDEVTNEAKQLLASGGISASAVTVTITGQKTAGGAYELLVDANALAGIPQGCSVSVKVEATNATIAWVMPTLLRVPKVSVATVMRKE
ncbi:MAG: pilus assembly protein [Planctomycetota bacterium]|nr:pilus assembly protein [Planctomycetota bacterium]